MGPVNADRMQLDTLVENTPPKAQLGSRPNSGLPIVSALALRRLGAILLLVGYQRMPRTRPTPASAATLPAT